MRTSSYPNTQIPKFFSFREKRICVFGYEDLLIPKYPNTQIIFISRDKNLGIWVFGYEGLPHTQIPKYPNYFLFKR